MKIWIDNGPAQGLNSRYIAISGDGQTWTGVGKENVQLKYTFTANLGNTLLGYPHTNQCLITISTNNQDIQFDIQDVQNQPTWINAVPSTTGMVEIAIALAAIGSW